MWKESSPIIYVKEMFLVEETARTMMLNMNITSMSEKQQETSVIELG